VSACEHQWVTFSTDGGTICIDCGDVFGSQEETDWDLYRGERFARGEDGER
jgi:hypothetical protein